MKNKKFNFLFILCLFLIFLFVICSIYVYGIVNTDYKLDDVEIQCLFESEQNLLNNIIIDMKPENFISMPNNVVDDDIIEVVDAKVSESLNNLEIKEFEEEFFVNNKLSFRNIENDVGSCEESIEEKYYRIFGENYINLVRSNEQGIRSTDIGGIRSTDIGGYVQPDNKDKSIKDTFINNNKERKKERTTENKAPTFDEIIDSYTDNEELRMELKEHLKTRKSKKATMTNRAIELSLNKLDKISSSDEEKIQIVQNAIMSGWTTFYPLKENNYKPINSYQEQKVTINGKEYIMKNGKYYVPRGSGIPVNPYAEDDLPF